MKFASSLNFAERSREGALTLEESLELIKCAGMDAIEIDLSRESVPSCFATNLREFASLSSERR